MTDASVGRAAERVMLACRSLSAAASDLRIEYGRHGLMAVDDAAQELEGELERVCELAEEIASLASNLRRWAPIQAATEGAAH